jgi:hypothetical protein
MKIKNFWLVVLASVLTVFVTDFLIHQVLLKDLYRSTAAFWRFEAEMMGFMAYMFAGQILVGVFFAWIFAFGYQGRGIAEGVRYGLLMGGLSLGQQLIMFAVQPFPTSLLAAWVVTCVIQSVIVGAVAAKVAKT